MSNRGELFHLFVGVGELLSVNLELLEVGLVLEEVRQAFNQLKQYLHVFYFSLAIFLHLLLAVVEEYLALQGKFCFVLNVVLFLLLSYDFFF